MKKKIKTGGTVMAQIRNYMEEIVFSQMRDILRDINVCNCEKCIMDIAALALNDLPPRYVVSNIGELYSKVNSLEQQFEVDIMTAIIKAAVIVKRKPQHEL